MSPIRAHLDWRRSPCRSLNASATPDFSFRPPFDQWFIVLSGINASLALFTDAAAIDISLVSCCLFTHCLPAEKSKGISYICILGYKEVNFAHISYCDLLIDLLAIFNNKYCITVSNLKDLDLDDLDVLMADIEDVSTIRGAITDY